MIMKKRGKYKSKSYIHKFRLCAIRQYVGLDGLFILSWTEKKVMAGFYILGWLISLIIIFLTFN